jgi:hypothetical protein
VILFELLALGSFYTQFSILILPVSTNLAASMGTRWDSAPLRLSVRGLKVEDVSELLKLLDVAPYL